jgi:hypothetical protein
MARAEVQVKFTETRVIELIGILVVCALVFGGV